jgi:hypothetical protein
MIGRRFRKGLALLLLLAWPTPLWAASAKSEKPPAVVPKKTTSTGAARLHAGSTAKQNIRPSRISNEDREVIKMMDLLQKMKMLQDMDLITATEEKR